MVLLSLCTYLTRRHNFAPLFTKSSSLAMTSSSERQNSSDTSRIVYVTCPNEEVAKRLSRGLLEQKLVACVNIIPSVTSLYLWENAIEESTEHLMMIKTEQKHVAELTNYVNQNHVYEIPEVISVKIDAGSEKYIDWIRKSVKPL